MQSLVDPEFARITGRTQQSRQDGRRDGFDDPAAQRFGRTRRTKFVFERDTLQLRIQPTVFLAVKKEAPVQFGRHVHILPKSGQVVIPPRSAPSVTEKFVYPQAVHDKLGLPLLPVETFRKTVRRNARIVQYPPDFALQRTIRPPGTPIREMPLHGFRRLCRRLDSANLRGQVAARQKIERMSRNEQIAAL